MRIVLVSFCGIARSATAVKHVYNSLSLVGLRNLSAGLPFSAPPTNVSPLSLRPAVAAAAAAAVLSKKDIAKKMEDRREEGLQQKIGEVRHQLLRDGAHRVVDGSVDLFLSKKGFGAKGNCAVLLAFQASHSKGERVQL